MPTIPLAFQRPGLSPMMAPEEIDAIKALLLRKQGEHPQGLPMALEWGSGGSTIYFSHFAGFWHSIEHSGLWVRRLTPLLPHNAMLHYIAVAGAMKRPKHHDEYIPAYGEAYRYYTSHPSKLGETFDVVLIDGRARVDCAQALIDYHLLNPGAVVIMHDWKRPRYRHALRDFNVLEEFNTQHGMVFLTAK